MGYYKYELCTINMLYSLKNFGSYYIPIGPPLLSPRWPLWRGSTVVFFKGRRPGIVYSPFSDFTR